LNDYAEAEKQLGEAHVDLFAAVNQRKEASDFEFVAADLPKLIEESREGVSRVSRIVQDLKNFSRAGDNEWQWADLHTGIESTINVVWNQLKYKAVMTRAYGELPQVFCVASQINQVVMNLLVNAGQAILEHGHITVRTGTEGDMVWIEVQDDGCGISAENQAKIFEPFYTSKPVGQGTGLGLSIASGIISRHQGTILLRSVLGVGTTFRIVLPINSHAVDAAQPTQTLDTKAGTP
jgi:signal transduction histidine kinase